MPQQPGQQVLSPREQQVYDLLESGMTAEKVAAHLKLSKNTVYEARNRALQKRRNQAHAGESRSKGDNMKRAIFVVLFMGLLSGQTADVHVLSKDDAVWVRMVHSNLQKAQQDWSEVNAKIKKSYHADGEIEFSRDFNAFVAKPTGGSGTIQGWGSGITWPACNQSGTSCTTTVPYRYFNSQ